MRPPVFYQLDDACVHCEKENKGQSIANLRDALSFYLIVYGVLHQPIQVANPETKLKRNRRPHYRAQLLAIPRQDHVRRAISVVLDRNHSFRLGRLPSFVNEYVREVPTPDTYPVGIDADIQVLTTTRNLISASGNGAQNMSDELSKENGNTLFGTVRLLREGALRRNS